MIKCILSPLLKRTFLFLIIIYFSPLYAYEIKGIWITRWELNSQKSIEILVDSLSVTNITDAYVQVFGNGIAYFNSDIAPRKYDNFDPLKIFIKYAKQKNIKVHAWINLFFVSGRVRAVNSEKHVLNTLYSEVLRDNDNISLNVYNKEQFEFKNIEGVYISPASDKYFNYISILIKELIDNYSIDGIHLDYCRYPGKEFINDINMKTKYQLIYNYSPDELYNDEIKRIYGDNYFFLLRIWKDFPKILLNNFIRDLYGMIKSINNNIQVSAAVKADINMASNYYYQYWWDWINNNYIDYVLIMSYSRDINFIKRQLNNIKTKTTLDKVVIGLATFNQSIENTKYNADLLSINPIKGICLFSSTSIKEKRRFSYVGKYIFK